MQEARRGIERYTLDYLGNLENSLSPAVVSNFSFGVQLVETREELVFATGEGLPVNSNKVVTAASLRSGGQTWQLDRAIGFIGQWQVGLNNRLFGQVGLRYDNASSFGRDATWVLLPTLRASWVTSEEPFWTFGFVNPLRFRVAWGTTGRIPQAGASLTTLQPAPYIEGTGAAAGAIPLNPGNAGLKFERGTEVEAQRALLAVHLERVRVLVRRGEARGLEAAHRPVDGEHGREPEGAHQHEDRLPACHLHG